MGVLLLTTGLCLLLSPLAGTETFEPLLFVLAVLVISRFTNGYFYGILSSVLGVLIVNLLFTYPYYHFNFTLTGYPISILCMLTVAISTGALTTRIKQQEQLRAEAEQEKMRSNLLRAVSHDLRTPLTGILGASSVVLENAQTLPQAEQLKLVSQINEDAQWLIRLVENLLTVTRMDASGGADITKEALPAEELVASVLSQFRKNFPQANIRVSVPEELLMVPMDAMLIQQVLLNLMENAVIHSGGATQITLSVERDGDSARFTVSDNGRGIDDQTLVKILDGDFVRTVGSSADKKRNMGIGLSVCNAIIAAHKGKMKAYNQKSGGAAFQFHLPLEERIEI